MTNYNLKPMGQRLLVKRLAAEEKIKGIILPDNAKKKQDYSEVLVLGDGISDVKVGDKVLTEKYTGQEISLNGEDLLLIKYTDIVALIN